jgi:hypothetical protein
LSREEASTGNGKIREHTMTADNTHLPTTVGKTRFYQGENKTQPLF